MSIVVLYCIVSFIVCQVWHRQSCRRRTTAVSKLGAVLFAGVFFLQPVSAQDTVRQRINLDEVEVGAQQAPPTMRTAVPTQVVDAQKIEDQGIMQLSDAVRQMAGVTLKDYGGVGGMKTVSVRGLGSQFSTLVVDGVAVDNSQNGQVDLGRYLLGNAAFVSLSQAHGEQSLMAARAYAAGNVISLESAEPVFFMAERTNLKVGMELGSFGLMSPSALWEQKWNKRLKTSLWVNYLKSDGDYPFTLYYTASHADSSSREIRRNSAMYMLTADGSIFYTIAKDNTLTAKVHYVSGMHQLPGDVVQYRTFDPKQSTHEESLLAQVRWFRKSGQWRTQLLGKVQAGYDQYEDSAYIQSADHYLENHYRQREGYLSGSAAWQAAEWLELRAAADGDLSALHSNLGYRNNVLRMSAIGVLAARAHKALGRHRIELSANMLATDIKDRVADLDTMPSYRRLSPYAALMWNIGDRLTLRYFYKETYRVPNFSELYFFNSIPKQLDPEKASQHNVGLSYMNGAFSGTIDGYFNRVEDKIVAKPGANMFYWSMDNLGLVHIYGVDATADFHLSSLTFHINYSFAHAIDLSDPTDEKVYGYQVRYMPRHSGGANVRWENRWVNLGATAMAVGHRYAYSQATDAYRLPAYVDVGLSADRRFDLRWGTMRVQVQVLNLLDTQYEVVKDYPMMGRNYRLSIMYEF